MSWRPEPSVDPFSEEMEPEPVWAKFGQDALDDAWEFLRVDERRVVSLVRLGKTPNEVARILSLSSRQLADKEIRRVGRVISFYHRWASEMRALSRLNLSIERERLFSAFVIERRSYRDIAAGLGVDRMAVVKRLRLLLDHLNSRGYAEHAKLVTETWSHRMLRVSMACAVGNRAEWSGKRRAMVVEPWRYDLRNLLFGLVGRVVYGWGRQWIDWKEMSGEADCSGLVIECLKRVGRLPKNFRDTTAQGLFDYYSTWTKKPSLCDLAFYGRDTRSVQHVMFYVGQKQLPLDTRADMPATEGLAAREIVIGMCDGAKDMCPAEARWLGAGLYARTSPRYRRDFVGYGVVK